MKTIHVQTEDRSEMIDVTGQVREAIQAAEFRNGLCVLYVPHTTAGITINESADPSVRRDILTALNRMVPWNADYQHTEGNSAAHIKSSLMGASQSVIVENGQMVLGTWQGIFFCEFDGPRRRKLQIEFIEDRP